MDQIFPDSAPLWEKLLVVSAAGFLLWWAILSKVMPAKPRRRR